MNVDIAPRPGSSDEKLQLALVTRQFKITTAIEHLVCARYFSSNACV